MGLSSHTFQLWSEAHTLGDEYYRGLTDLHCNGRDNRDECESLAARYLAALEMLENHVSTLDDSEEAAAIQKSTRTFIQLIQADLKLFQDYSTSKPQGGYKRMIGDTSSDGRISSPSRDGNR